MGRIDFGLGPTPPILCETEVCHDTDVARQTPLSAEEGWPALARLKPGILKVFLLLVLPLSMLPPVMLYYAGLNYPEVFGPGASGRNWFIVGTVFFLAELATFLLMGWLIKQVGQTYSLVIDYHDAYLLAAIAPVPLWLSSLGLLIPNLLFNATVSAVALGVSCALLYQGCRRWAASMTQSSRAASCRSSSVRV